MPTTFNPKITAAGLAAAIAADGAGLDLQLTHVALGSAKYNPTGSETALVDRRETTTIAPGASAGAATLAIIATFSGYSGADYDLGEVGFFAGDPGAGGVLFAVASRAGLRYAIRGAAVETYTAQFTVALSGVPAGSINVTVDATGNVAASLVAGHVAAVNPHPQYVRKAGDTMTGALLLHANASAALQAVPKQQLDAAISAIGVGAQSLTANGYQMLPGGLLMQWFSASFPNVPGGVPGFIGSASFPIAFPTACLICLAGSEQSAVGDNNWHISVISKSTTGIDFKVEEWAPSDNPGTAVFIALGF